MPVRALFFSVGGTNVFRTEPVTVVVASVSIPISRGNLQLAVLIYRSLNTLHSTYHEYVEAQGSKFAPPDLAIAFNSGCGSVETQLWEPTLSLLAARKIPSLFTVRVPCCFSH